MRPFRFHRAAREEVRAATLWYRERSADAARDFAAAVRCAIEGMRVHPDAWPAWRSQAEVRHRVLRRFPFSIVYVLERDVVIVLAVAHHRRRPGYWLDRLRR